MQSGMSVLKEIGTKSDMKGAYIHTLGDKKNEFRGKQF